ncbi:unnamed protein product, partial [Ceratitis capitata]
MILQQLKKLLLLYSLQYFIVIAILIAVAQAVPIELGHYGAPILAHAPVLAHAVHAEPVV